MEYTNIEFVSIDNDYDIANAFAITDWSKFFDKIEEANTLQKLELCSVSLDKDIEKWCDLISRLSDLKIVGCCEDAIGVIDKIIEALQQNDNITNLTWFYENLESDQFCRLAEMVLSKPQLTKLNFFEVKLETIPQIEALCRIIKSNQLTTLTISGCLDLGFSTLDPSFKTRFFEALDHNNTLEYFSANDIGLQNDASVQLAKWLENCTSIKTLIIRNNSIGDEGYKALFAALEQNKSLEQLYICNNPVTNTIGPFLKTALEKNETLNLLDIDLPFDLFDYILSALDTNVTLTSLNRQTDSEQMEEKLERNKTLLRERPNWAIIIHNIVRSELFELLPSEIWDVIFGHLMLNKLAKRIFRLYNKH